MEPADEERQQWGGHGGVRREGVRGRTCEEVLRGIDPSVRLCVDLDVSVYLSGVLSAVLIPPSVCLSSCPPMLGLSVSLSVRPSPSLRA